MKRPPIPRRRQAGTTLVEVLVSILILMFGLLGLVGVLVQSQMAQLESFQRQQAILLAQDMVQRMMVNKAAANCYVLTASTYLGVDQLTVPAAGTCTGTAISPAQASRFNQDMSDWLALLQGSGELLTGGTVGGIPSARGCVAKDPVTGIYQVSVAWQGSAATSAPPAGVTCGQNLYGPTGADTARRAVALTVLL